MPHTIFLILSLSKDEGRTGGAATPYTTVPSGGGASLAAPAVPVYHWAVITGGAL